MNGIWITWETQRRNIGISSALEFPLYQFDINSNLLNRYAYCLYLTVKTIYQKNPDIVVAQNPSILLATLVVLVGKIKKYHSVIDAHNSGIYPLEGSSKILLMLARWLQRNASLTIITNQELKKVVEKNGGNGFILPDAIPTLPSGIKSSPLNGKINITYICTFNDDEPYKEILEAINFLHHDIHIYITGKFQGKIDPKTTPLNAHLTGYIPDDQYWNLLNSSDIIIDLTLRENCLVCGAYEGIALDKPLILSKTKALQTYFYKGCIYTTSETREIYRAIMKAIDNLDTLVNEIKELKMELNKKWEEKISSLKDVMMLLSVRNRL